MWLDFCSMSKWADTKLGEVDTSEGRAIIQEYIDKLEDVQIMQMHDV